MSSPSSSLGAASPVISAKPSLVIPEIPSLDTTSASLAAQAANAKKRCGTEGCRKKLSPTQLIVGLCKCGICYCETHRLPESHTCTVDRRKLGEELLTRQLVKVVGEKMERI